MGQQNFGSWLVRQQKSQVSFWAESTGKVCLETHLKNCWIPKFEFHFPARRIKRESLQLSICWTFPERHEHGLRWRNVQRMASWSRYGARGKRKTFYHCQGRVAHRFSLCFSHGTLISAITRTRRRLPSLHCQEITCWLRNTVEDQLCLLVDKDKLSVAAELTTNWLTIIWLCKRSSEVIR